jgi:DMSO/TMAO reductase YedYZ heme-binding membrane subunit
VEHKNDYSVIAFTETGETKKWQYVHKLNGFALFLTKQHPSWKYFNVYDRRTGQYLKRFYKGNFIPPFLSFFLTFSILFNLYQNTFYNGFNNPATIRILC